MALDAAAKSASQLFTFKENANTDDGSYHNPRVFLDIQIGMRKAGRIVIELFADIVPKTAEVSPPSPARLACACLPHLPPTRRSCRTSAACAPGSGAPDVSRARRCTTRIASSTA